jgi:tripeptide aminopeptidase
LQIANGKAKALRWLCHFVVFNSHFSICIFQFSILSTVPIQRLPATMLSPYLKQADDLLLKLLSIPGLSGEEEAVMNFITTELRKAGATEAMFGFDQAHRKIPHGGACGNLVLKLPGTRPGMWRMLMAHTDTVPICRGAKPVEKGQYIVPADKNTGLGGDDRSGTAAILAAALHVLKEKRSHGPLTFLWTVQEEVGLYGARFCDLRKLGKPTLAFNFDGGPTDKVTIGATGGYRMDIRITGTASHAGAAPEQGVSAITIAALAIAELHREGWLGKVKKPGGSGTSNVGVIHGGEATNVVTPEVLVRAEARSHDPAFRKKIIKAIEAAFKKAARRVKNVEGTCGQVEINGRLDYESFRLHEDSACVYVAESAIRSLGGTPIRSISNGGLDANWISARGIPTVTLGCGQENIHTAGERLDCDEFHRACEIARMLAAGG